MGLFIKKPFAALQAEANESGNKTLKRVLGPWSLIALGVGVIIGAGLFSITGTVAAGYTGPAITLSFAIAAIGCCFAGLCYAEFAYVMTGVAHYSDFAGQQGIAPVAVAIDHMGHADATGVIHPDYPWLNRAIVLAILFGYCSVIG
jgi:hypothetical protein